MQTLSNIRARIAAACQRAARKPEEITLLGASKSVAPALLEPFLAAGMRDFGENYIQEGVRKIEFFQTKDWAVNWHFIGALQSNKAREAVRFGLIHSLDRLSVARELEKEARKIGKVQRVLVQVNVGDEESKAGVRPQSLGELLEKLRGFSHLRVEGLMSLPPLTADPESSRPSHRQLREYSEQYCACFASPFPILSMGMSADFEVAIEEGATHVRVGAALFGARR